MQIAGTAAEWMVDQIADPLKKLTKATGLYSKPTGQMTYTAIKGTGRLLRATGKTIHRQMDRLVQPLENMKSCLLERAISKAASISEKISKNFLSAEPIP